MTQPAPFQNLTRRTEQERRTTADKFAQSYAQRGTPMGREKQPDTTKTTPVPPAPAGTVRGVFGNVKPVSEIPPIPDINFGNNPKLDDHFGKDAPDDVEPLFDATASQSPDVAGSPTPDPTTDVNATEAVVKGEPPHWSETEQNKQFCDFVMGLINDYGLFDRDELGALKEWTCLSFIDRHGILLLDYPTYSEARKAVAAKALEAFKQDLKAIAAEKGHPITTRNDLYAFINYYTIEDALQKMAGTGIRAAIDSKLNAWEQAQHIEQTNANTQKHLDEQKAEQAKPEPTVTYEPPQRKPAPATGNPFQPATDDGVFLKMAIAGPSGSGKSYTSLKIAREMFPDGKVAFLCTEHKAARRYAKFFKFDLMELTEYHPEKFIRAIKDAERYGYDILIIDSLSHEWSGAGGILSLADGKFGGWKEATPMHQKVIETIQDANIHIIATMRSKMDYVQEQNANGKTTVKRLGMAPVQRDQTEYEFDIFAEIDMNSELTIAKSRCFQLKAGNPFQLGNGLAPILRDWVA